MYSKKGDYCISPKQQAPSPDLHGSLLNWHDKWLYKQSACGCKLKSSCCNYERCLLLLYFFRAAVSAQRQKQIIDGIKPSWSLVFIVCYLVCFGALSQRRAIAFPMLLSPGMWIATGWVLTAETEWACPPPKTLSRASEDAADITVFREIKKWHWHLDVENKPTDCVR